jgi:Zn-dependent metalloprotease
MIKKTIVVLFVIIFVIPLYLLNPNVVETVSSELTVSEMEEAKELFSKNKFSLENLLPCKIIKDNEGTTQVRTYQIYQGVQVYEEVYLNFETATGEFSSLSGYPAPNLPISNNPSVESNAELVEKSMRKIDGNNTGYLSKVRPIDIKTTPKIPAYVASFLAHISQEYLTYLHPLEARLVVYDKNSTSDLPQKWTLAWEITPKNEKYPVVIVDANTGSILYSYDGLYVEVIRQISPTPEYIN